MIAKYVLALYARPALAARMGRSHARDVMTRAIARCESSPHGGQRTLGGRLMVYCARLTVALYRELLAHGMDEQEARQITTEVTTAVYRQMAKLPWRIAQTTARSPIARLRRATRVFRRFPFSAPSYVMQDVASSADMVAFDVKHCPVAEYFRAEGLESLCVDSFCNLDFDLARRWGAELHRTKTLAAGDELCDFRWKVRSPTSESAGRQS